MLQKKTFQCKSDKLTGDWMRQHIEQLHDRYSLPNIIRAIRSRMGWVGHVARIGERRDTYRVLVEEPEEKRTFGRPRRRCEENIKIYHQ